MSLLTGADDAGNAPPWFGIALPPAGTLSIAPLRPSRETMLRHVELLFRDALEGLVELAWLAPERSGSGARNSGARLFAVDELDDLVEQAIAWNAAGQNVYIGATLRRPDAPRNKRALDVDVLEAPAIWADFDEPGAAARAADVLRDHGCVPTAVVTTGRVPFTRAHFWWRMDEPIRDMAALRAQVAGLAAVLGGDATVVNAGRLMRLAGSVAWPTTAKPGRVPELVELDARGPVSPAGAVERLLDKLGQQRAPLLAAQQRLASPAMTAPATTRDDGLVADGRETYMRDTVRAVFSELVGTIGAWPTPEKLFEAAAPQIEARVDLTRSGRISADKWRAELWSKCRALVEKAQRGDLAGARTLEEAVERYRARQHRNAHPGTSAGLGGASARQPGVPTDLAREFTLCDPRLIPPRRWLYGNVYIRSFVSVLAAAGGAGKTSLYIAEALAIVSGKPLLGIVPAERTGVWLLNLEDPLDEMQRRIGAAAKYFAIEQDAIAGRLFLDAGREEPVIIADQTRDGVTIHRPLVNAIVEAIRRKGIGVVIVDPFIGSHRVNESDTMACHAVIAEWRRVADLTGACVLLVHHLRKGNGVEATADAIRGSNTIVGAVRTGRVLNAMSEADAAKFGIEKSQRRRFVRIDDAKNNLSAPSERDGWFELRSIHLENGGAMRIRDTKGAEIEIRLDGDQVGVAVPWSPPNAHALATDDHAREAVEFLKANGRQRAHHTASEWFGREVIRICGLSTDAKGKHEAKAILAQWVAAGVLRKEKRPDPRQGKEIPVYAAGIAPGSADVSSLPHLESSVRNE